LRRESSYHRTTTILIFWSERETMKANVWVMLKSTVLDPQGQTIQRALSSLGYSAVQDVRQGKFFVLQLDGLNREQATAQVEKLAKDVLTNPVIEEFRFEILD
jgi:phosphoribosylformylglycinamidine synthase PurS subunit